MTASRYHELGLACYLAETIGVDVQRVIGALDDCGLRLSRRMEPAADERRPAALEPSDPVRLPRRKAARR